MIKHVTRIVVFLAAFLAAPSMALAHAGLESSDPSPGAYLEASPDRVVLSFDEPVLSAFGSVRILDSSANVIDESPLAHGETKDVVVADLDGSLDDGTYVVLWRVTSSDGHPVQGSFTFVVGNATTVVDDAIASAATQEHGLSRLFVVIRLSVFVALALLVGALVLLWSGTQSRLSRQAEIVVKGSWLVLLVATVEAVFAFGPHAAGVKIYKALDPDLLRATLTTTFGRAQLVRLVLLCLLWPLIGRFIAGFRDKRVLVPVVVVLVTTVSISGHALATSPMILGVAIDVVHLLGISTWIGGLMTLAIASRRLSDDEALALTSRFSRLAQIAMPVVVATGVAQSWLLVGDLTEIFDTQYGRTLIVKVALVAVVVALSGTARRSLKRRDAQNLRTTIAFEVVVALAVIALTASLTGLSPKTVSRTEPFQQTIVGTEVFVTLAITPARVGETEVHLIMAKKGGALGELLDVQMRMALESMNIPSGPVPLTRIASNHYTANVTFPFPGNWSIEVLASTEPFAVSRYAFEVPISQ